MYAIDASSPPAMEQTTKVTHRTNRSIPMFLLQHLIKPFNTAIIKPGKPLPAGSPRLTPHSSAKKHCEVKETQVEGIYIYELVAKCSTGNESNGDNGKRQKRRLYYFAGGGWQMPPSSQHWTLCAELCRQLPNTTVSLVSYPLAPNSPAPVAFPQLMKMYKRLLQDAEEAGEKVILAGDSAGGNVILCLALVGFAEDENAPCPTDLLAISPSTDLRRNNPEIKVVEKHDPILRISFIGDSAKKWRAGWEASDPRVTPILGDVSALARRGVRVHGVFGRYDILSPDAALFRVKCEETGVRGEWLEWEKQMHCFPLAWAYRLPESVEAKDWILDVLRRC